MDLIKLPSVGNIVVYNQVKLSRNIDCPGLMSCLSKILKLVQLQNGIHTEKNSIARLIENCSESLSDVEEQVHSSYNVNSVI